MSKPPKGSKLEHTQLKLKTTEAEQPELDSQSRNFRRQKRNTKEKDKKTEILKWVWRAEIWIQGHVN